jgi:hypothetical protein
MRRRQRKSRDRRRRRTTRSQQTSSAPDRSQQAYPMRWLVPVGLVIVAVATVGLLWIYRSAPPAGEPRDRGMPTRGAVSHAEPALVDQAALPSVLPSSWSKLDDPGRDGWQSEVLAGRAGKQLDKLKELLVSRAEIRSSQVRTLMADRFVCPTPLPGLEVVYEGALFRVERGEKEHHAARSAESNGSGPEVLSRELSKLTASFLAGQRRRAKIKIISVQPESDTFTTRQLLSTSGETDAGLLERHVKFSAQWTVGGAEQPPKLVQLDFEDFEQSHSRQRTQPLFVDCTEAVLGGNRCYREQFLYGYNHWLERTQDRQYFYVLGTPGVTLGDVNNDGLEDMYVCQEAGLPNRLFIQQADGTFRDVSREAGADWLESSRTALLIDLDNDGNQDLIVGVLGGVVLAAGDGKGRCTLMMEMATVWAPCDLPTSRRTQVSRTPPAGWPLPGATTIAIDGRTSMSAICSRRRVTELPSSRSSRRPEIQRLRIACSVSLVETRCCVIEATEGLTTKAARPLSRWAVGPGVRDSWTSTTTLGKILLSPTATSRPTTPAICEASSGGRSCRKAHRVLTIGNRVQKRPAKSSGPCWMAAGLSAGENGIAVFSTPVAASPRLIVSQTYRR